MRISTSRSLLRASLGSLITCLFMLAVSVFVEGSSLFADVIFTDRATFEAGLPSGFYTDDFSNAQIAVGAPISSHFGSGGTPTIGYMISAPPGGLFIGQLVGDPVARFIGPWEDSDDLVVTFNASNVYRVGIDVSVEDAAGPVSRMVTFNFSSGASSTINLPAQFSFFGIYSDVPLDWMSIQASGGGVFTNTTRLTTAVPEPSSWVLSMGGGYIAFVRRRRSYGVR